MSLPWERCPREPTAPQARLQFVVERDPLLFPSCFTEPSHGVKPSGEQGHRVQHKRWSKPRLRRDVSLLPSALENAGGWLQATSSPVVPGLPSGPVTQGRAREGSLHSSTWLWGPYRCSRAARSVGRREEKGAVRESRVSHTPCRTVAAGAGLLCQEPAQDIL